MSDCDNAVYSEVADATGKGFTMSENKCYGDVGYAPRTAVYKSSSSTKVPVFLLLAIVIVSLLATVSACIALGLEIAQLKSDTATHQESQNALVSRIESTEILLQQLMEVLNSTLSGAHANIPTHSCAALPPSSPSGYYWVRASNGSAVRVYCDMTRSCGDITGGWVRVAELDMTNSSHQCPSGLNDANIHTYRSMESSDGCSSVMIDIPYSYSRVCGRVIAYQVGTTDAFADALGRMGTNTMLEDVYVDGVSLTHGEPRQRVWTFAAGFDEKSVRSMATCPCTTNSGTIPPPNFVRNDYFCEAGTQHNTLLHTTVYIDDPLWDEDDCIPSNSFNTCYLYEL